MVNSDDTKELNAETLGYFGITFDKTLVSGDDALDKLPKRVQLLREGLLSPKGRIIKEYMDQKIFPKSLEGSDKNIPSKDSKSLEGRDKDIPSKDFYAAKIDFETQNPSEIARRLNAEMDLAVKLLESAVFLADENCSEARWEHALLDTVFRHLDRRESPARQVI